MVQLSTSSWKKVCRACIHLMCTTRYICRLEKARYSRSAVPGNIAIDNARLSEPQHAARSEGNHYCAAIYDALMVA